MLCFESRLTEQEEKARDEMIYLFNPVLKFILLNKGYDEFKRYGFNSCRQTAIFGAFYLRKLLPNYNLHVYEGKFIEKENGIVIPYIHAFIIAEGPNDRQLIIDISRTTKRLLFTEVYPNIYPNFDDYKNVVKLWEEKIDLDKMINTDEPEYLTGCKPKNLIQIIETLIEDLKTLPKQKQLEFCDKIYSKTTQLRR